MKYVKNFYLGINHRNEAVFVNEDNSKQYNYRKKRAYNWANITGTSNVGRTMTLSNTPATGFKITGTPFKILDPRGFSVDLNQNNLSKILSSCVIDHGYIQGSFLYLRNEGKVWLVEENSEEHKEALKVPEGKKPAPKYLQPKDLQAGDIVIDRRGNEYQYLGMYRTTWQIQILEKKAVTYGKAINTVDDIVLDTEVTNQWQDWYRKVNTRFDWEKFTRWVSGVKVDRNEPVVVMTEEEERSKFNVVEGLAQNLLTKAASGLLRHTKNAKLLKVEHKLPKRRAKKENKDAEATDE